LIVINIFNTLIILLHDIINTHWYTTTMDKVSISVQKLKKNLENILNKKISIAWKGYGSALFLELGNLHNELAWGKGGKPTSAPTGEWTLLSDGAWRLIRQNGITALAF
jgi:hypothetical protein